MSSLLAAISANASALRSVLYTSTCQRKVGAVVERTFACYYEQTQPRPGGPLDFETGDGYGYTVFAHPDDVIDSGRVVAMNEGNVIAVDGFNLEVQRVIALGNLDPDVRFECTRR